jgi:hypothetical protein
MVLQGIREVDTFEKRDVWIGDLNDLTKNLFSIINPKLYERWQKQEQNRRNEEGVDEVRYRDAPQTEEEMQEILREFGL